MDLQLNRPSRQSAVSGLPFNAGDIVFTLLYKAKDGFERVDLLESELESYQTDAPLLCRWRWEVKPRDGNAREAARNVLVQTEELFLAVCHAVPEEDEPLAVVEDRAALRHLLSLMLLRKRLIRPVPGRPNYFLHPASGQELHVPQVRLSPQVLRRVAPQISVV